MSRRAGHEFPAAVFMAPCKLSSKRYLVLEYRSWCHSCIVPFAASVFPRDLHPYSACLLFYAIEFSFSNISLCCLSSPFFFHIPFRLHPPLSTSILFRCFPPSLFHSFITILPPFSTTWCLTNLLPLNQCFTAGSSRTRVSSFDVRPRHALHRDGAVPSGAAFVDSFQALPVNPWQCMTLTERINVASERVVSELRAIGPTSDVMIDEGSILTFIKST